MRTVRLTSSSGGALGLLALWLASVLGCGSAREKLPPEAASQPSDSKAVRVTVQPVSFRPVERVVAVVGTLHGYEEVALGTKVAGRVKRISHEVSDQVRPDELLLEIDATDYQLNVRQAQRALQVELAKLGLSETPTAKVDVTHIPTVVQAQLRRDNAQIRLDRTKTLVARKASPEEELTEKLSEFRVAQAEFDNQVLVAKAGIASIQVKQEALSMAQQQLQDTLIRVPSPSRPFEGSDGSIVFDITSRAVSEGSYVMAGQELFKLVIKHPLKFRGTVPERKSASVRLGQETRLHVAAFDRPFRGEVTRINPAIDPATRSFEVEVIVPNPRAELKPGGFAKADILTEVNQEATTVPLEALVYFAGITKIFLLEGSVAKEVHVVLGVQGSDWAEVASPELPRGAMVITSGQSAIADGVPVMVRATADAASAPVARKEAAP
jgi:RND family efflux transporter MFP subunit